MSVKRESGVSTGEPEVEEGIFIPLSRLEDLLIAKANLERIVKQIHDVLKSYYKVARKRFVGTVCQQVVNSILLSWM